MEVIHGMLDATKPNVSDIGGYPGEWLIKTGTDGPRVLVLRDGPDGTTGRALTFKSKASKPKKKPGPKPDRPQVYGDAE